MEAEYLIEKHQSGEKVKGVKLSDDEFTIIVETLASFRDANESDRTAVQSIITP